MTPARLILSALLATLVLAATACGGGSESVPAGAVASVAGTPISKEQFDSYMGTLKRRYEQDKQQFPKAGTPEYQRAQTQVVSYLVAAAMYKQAADDLGIDVTEQEVDKAEKAWIKANHKGDVKEYEKALKAAGFTREQYREKIKNGVLDQKIFEAVTKDVQVTDQDILGYYTANQSQFGKPESREVRHILIAEKNADDSVDFAASKKKAEEVEAQLEGGANFATLAKQLSDDPGTKDLGGKITVNRDGSFAPEFEAASFDLKTGERSKLVKTMFGYHIIEAVSDIQKAKTTPLAEVRDQIKLQLLQQLRNEELQKWVEDLRSDYKNKVSYAAGYEPPAVPEAPTETQ